MILVDGAIFFVHHIVEILTLMAIYAAPSFFLWRTGVYDGTERQFFIVLNLVLGWTIIVWFFTLYRSFVHHKVKLR